MVCKQLVQTGQFESTTTEWKKTKTGLEITFTTCSTLQPTNFGRAYAPSGDVLLCCLSYRAG
jgi:hypothetical protein